MTVVLVFNAVLLLLARPYKKRFITMGSILFLALTMILYCYLIIGLIKANSTISNIPFYIAYLYCLFFSGILIVNRVKK